MIGEAQYIRLTFLLQTIHIFYFNLYFMSMEPQYTEPQIPKSKKTKKLLMLVLSFLAIVAMGYYIFNINSDNISKQPYVNKFSGQVVGIEGELVKLRGVYVSSIPFDKNSDLGSERDFSFPVDGATTFKKLEIRHPNWEELRATGKTSGTYNIADLPRFEGVGSFDDLKKYFLSNQDITIEADFSTSIIDSENAVASSVFYTIMIMPEAPKIP